MKNKSGEGFGNENMEMKIWKWRMSSVVFMTLPRLPTAPHEPMERGAQSRPAVPAILVVPCDPCVLAPV